MSAILRFMLPALSVLALSAASAAHAQPFTVAVVPDTQNYVDYTHQKSSGFPVNGVDFFMEQMRYLATHAKANGGDIAFSISLGDMWQHDSVLIDPAYVARGFRRTDRPFSMVREETRSFEIPAIVKGYQLIAGKIPFSVVPGNHDFDGSWRDADTPSGPSRAGDYRNGAVLMGGLENFRSAFGADSAFFKGKAWFIGSSPSGGDLAQVFDAGGYRFLQIGFQYDPPSESLRWAQDIIGRYPGLPTIISIHAYLKASGDRINEIEPDFDRNNPEVLWQKFISQNDQIFLVLAGHWCGQGYRNEPNRFGHAVYQAMADFQCRSQAVKDTGEKAQGDPALGDGWLRLMRFDLAAAAPAIRVRTYSTHYKAFSTDLPHYAEWYKNDEWPNLTDADFLKQDDFEIRLDDFKARFGAGKAG